MKKLMLVAIVGAFVFGSLPAQARTISSRRITFSAPVPCTGACAYWLEEANSDVDGDEKDDIYFNACRAPFPDGSYDDYVVKAPRYSRLLTFRAYPMVDWDIFICSKPTRGNNGRVMAVGANDPSKPCDNVIGPDNPVPIGCSETARIAVVPGRRYVLRAYNWSDPQDLPARYWFTT